MCWKHQSRGWTHGGRGLASESRCRVRRPHFAPTQCEALSFSSVLLGFEFLIHTDNVGLSVLFYFFLSTFLLKHFMASLSQCVE